MPRKGYKQSDEHKEKLRQANLGKKLSDKTKEKMRIRMLGKNNPNYGGLKEETKEKLRQINLGKTHSEETKQKMSESHKGIIFLDEHRRKLSESQKGENNSMWNGGVSSERQKIYNSPEYKEWRLAVFDRDNFSCHLCGENRYVNAHHIKKFSDYPDLRFDVNNGATLCKECHLVITGCEEQFEELIATSVSIVDNRVREANNAM